jgi:hypothetical protein
MDIRHRGEDGLGIQPQLDRGLLQFVREHVQQHLGVGVRVDVPQVLAEHLVLELVGVGQVAVMSEDDPERRVDVERLSFGRVACRAGGRVAAVRDADVARQRAHVARAEYVAHHAVALLHVKGLALAGNDASGVLAAMLQQQQPVVEQLVDGRTRDDSENATHRDRLPVFGPQ